MSTKTSRDFLATGDIAGLIAHRAAQFGDSRMELNVERSFDEQIDELTVSMRTLVDSARDDSNRAMTDEEVERFEALEAELAEVESARDAHEATAARERAVAEREAARASRPGTRVLSEPSTYSGRNGTPSYFRDLIGLQRGDSEARERLARNNTEVERSDSTRALSTTNGAAGEFVPPLWLVDQFVKLARPGRPFADAMPHFDVPAGTDSINIPRVKTGTQVAQQTSQNTAVQQTDLTTDSISASVFTLAGGQTVSMQLIEQSPINVDTVVLGDLAADYARQFDSFLINNNSTGAVGLVASAAAAPAANKLTAATFDASTLWSKLAGAFAAVNAGRYAPADLIVMHPRRWAAISTLADNTGRPLIVPNGPALNSLGLWGDGLAPQGVVGTLMDTPVLIDPAVPTNQGAGTDQDEIFVLRRQDQMVFESGLKAGVFQETYANQLSWLFRIYAYGAFTFGRYSAAIASISGAGLAAPTF